MVEKVQAACASSIMHATKWRENVRRRCGEHLHVNMATSQYTCSKPTLLFTFLKIIIHIVKFKECDYKFLAKSTVSVDQICLQIVSFRYTIL